MGRYTTKAVVWTRYGEPEVLQLRDVEKPNPRDNEILIRIRATTVTAGDCETRAMRFPLLLGLAMRVWRGIFKPRGISVLGTEIAGEIEEIGKGVTQFSVGDEVFGSAGMGFGANAEYICLPEEPGELEGGVALKPDNMSFEEAATVPFGGRDALHFLRTGGVRAGQKILINGAGGTIGTYAVQLAKHHGLEVTCVDSGEKLDMLRSIGADHTVDYREEDFTNNGVVYDIVFDVVGKISFFRSRKSIKPDGTYLLANPTSQVIRGLWTSMTTRKKVIMTPASGTVDDLVHLRQLVETGKIKAVIDRRYPLEEVVEAHRYVETGAKQGNVVVLVN